MLQHVILVETIAFIKLLKISVKNKRCSQLEFSPLQNICNFVKLCFNSYNNVNDNLPSFFKKLKQRL